MNLLILNFCLGIMELEKFIEILFYGSSFASYDSGINLNSIVSEMHKKYFGNFNSFNNKYSIGFSDIY